ncbi:MAG: hypothetical protein WBG38_14600 [Nodosilinea sp.]
MIRQLFAAAIALLPVGAFLWSPPLAIAATQDYTPSQQESQSYPSQAEYEKQESGDYSYTTKQEDQSRSQEKQLNQADANEKQYAQQAQSYLKQ